VDPIHPVNEYADPEVLALGAQIQFLAQFGSLLVLAAKVAVGAHVRGDEDMPVYEATEGAQEVQGGKSQARFPERECDVGLVPGRECRTHARFVELREDRHVLQKPVLLATLGNTVNVDPPKMPPRSSEPPGPAIRA
jgi:hypothetical protein